MRRIVGRKPGGGHRRLDSFTMRKTRSPHAGAAVPRVPGAALAREASARREGQYMRYGQAPSAMHPAASGVVGAAYMPPCEPEGEIYLAPTPGGSGRRPGTRGSCLVEESASERVADELRAGLETELL